MKCLSPDGLLSPDRSGGPEPSWLACRGPWRPHAEGWNCGGCEYPALDGLKRWTAPLTPLRLLHNELTSSVSHYGLLRKKAVEFPECVPGKVLDQRSEPADVIGA